MRYGATTVRRKSTGKKRPATAPASNGRNLRPNQQALIRLQQQHGNRFVQRHLASLQREEEKKGGSKTKAKEQDNGAGGFEGFVSEQVYDAIKDNMSEAKLKGYATDLAKLAADEIIKAISEGNTDPSKLEELSAALSNKMLKTQLERALQDIFAGPAGQKLRSKLLSMSQDPHQAVGLALLGLAAMIASNAEIPQLKKSYSLGAGFSVDGSAKLGKFQDIAIHHVGLGLKYSSKHFKSDAAGSYAEKSGAKATADVGAEVGPVKGGVSATYKSEGDDAGTSGQANIVVGTDEAKAELAGKLTPAGDFNLNVSSALNLEEFAFSAGAGYDSIKGWSGVGELRIGPKQHHLSLKQSFNPGTESTFAFGPKLNHDVITAMALLNMSAANQTLDASVALKKPFGIQDFSVKAFLLTDIDDGVLKKAGLEGNWTLHQKFGPKGETESLVLLTFDAQFVAEEDTKPAGAEGAVLLQALW